MIDTSEIPTGPHGSIVVGLPSRIAMTLNPVSTSQATLDLLDSTIKDQPDPVLVFYPYCFAWHNEYATAGPRGPYH